MADNGTAKAPRLGHVTTFPIDKIKIPVYVRRHLNDDRVQHFAELLEAGQELEPIKVALGTHELLEGRHRIAARRLLDLLDINVKWVEAPKSREEHLLLALNENLNGPLPPSRSDIQYVVEQLLGLGVTKSAIIRQLPFPSALGRRYVQDVERLLITARVGQAKTAVVDEGLTVADAARKYRVPELRVRSALDGKTTMKANPKMALADIKGNLTFRLKQFAITNGALVKRLMEGYAIGDVDPSLIRGVLDHLELGLSRMRKTQNEWRKRFETEAQRQKDAATIPLDLEA